MSDNKKKTRSARTSGTKSSGRFSKAKRFLASPAVTMVLFGLAIVMLLGSTIGGARAVLTYTSEYYNSRVQMFNIGVSLWEQCGENKAKMVSWRNYDLEQDGYWDDDERKDAVDNSLLTDLLASGEEIQLGRMYPEKLYVQNSGDIDQYVRVTIYKYWVNPPELDDNGEVKRDSEGEVVRKKLPELSPSLIDLHLINCGKSGEGQPWILDEASSTKERTVLYYRDILKAPGDGVADEETRTVDLTDYLKIDSAVADKAYQTTTTTQDGKYTTITTTYIYDGVEFRIKAQVDAVQTHSAKDAIWSAWGREVEIDGNGSLTSVK